MFLHQLVLKTTRGLSEVTVTQPFGEGYDVFKVIDKVFMLSFQLTEPHHIYMIKPQSI